MNPLKNSTKKRDPSVELYRIVLMFGICLQHCVCQGLWSGSGFPKNILGACVPGFVFISGWFGVRFSLSKLIRLYSVPVYASLLAPLCGGELCGGGYWHEVIRVWHADGGFWFIHAYAVLMVLAPMVNLVLERSSSIRESILILFPVIAISLGWGALRHYRCLGDFIPSTPGLVAGSGLTLLAIYCVGRLLHLADIESRVSTRCVSLWGIALSALVSFTSSWFSTYNNPICFGVSVCGFLLFRKIPVRGSFAKTVLWLSPFMFAVYCISGTIYFPGMPHEFFAFVETTKKYLYGHGTGITIATIGAAMFSFAVGILLALPRYLFAVCFQRCLCSWYEIIDCGYGKLLKKISQILER